MHFKDSYQAEEAINKWPGKVFGEKESVHRPRDNSGPKVGFVKNVAPRYFKHQILQILKDKGCTVSDRQKHNQIGIVSFTFCKIKKFLKSLIFGIDCLFDILHI